MAQIIRSQRTRRPNGLGISLDPAGLRTIAAACQHEVSGAGHDGSGEMEALVTMARLEARLRDVADRLEGAAEALDRRVDGGPRAEDGQEGGRSDDVLARESDHRIKNSLQTVMALLHQQAARVGSDEAREALLVASGRVAAVAQVHVALYGSLHAGSGPALLDLREYLHGLCGALSEASGVNGLERRLEVDVAPLAVAPAAGQSLGLIVSELVMNAFRHGLPPDGPGTVRVCGRDVGNGRYALSVSDDGRGLPREFDLRLRPSGLGLRLVNRLADQLKATVSVANKGGAWFSIDVPVGRVQG